MKYNRVGCVKKKNIYLAFDIDGTIYDAGDILEEAFSEGIESYIKKKQHLVLRKPSREEITATLGLPLEEIFLLLFSELDEAARSELAFICTENLVRMIREKKGTLLDGVFETIAELNRKNYKMLVASNGVRAYVEAILETYDLKKFFSKPFVYPEGSIVNKTGVVEHYILVLDDLEQIIMIGDRYTDLEAAVKNSIPFIGCAFGHAGADEIIEEKYIVNSFREIPDIIREIAVEKGVRASNQEIKARSHEISEWA